MAYVNFSEVLAPLIPTTVRVAAEPVLDAIDLSVVHLARHDRLSSLGTVSRARRIVEWAFGFSHQNRLADPRLEALRAFAVRTRHGREIDGEMFSTLFALGYSAAQIDLVRRLAARPRKASPLAAFHNLKARLESAATAFWVRSRLGDSLLAAIVVAYLGLPLVVTVPARAV